MCGSQKQALQPLSAPDLHSFAISFLHTRTLFLNCASQRLEAGCATAAALRSGQTSDRGVGLPAIFKNCSPLPEADSRIRVLTPSRKNEQHTVQVIRLRCTPEYALGIAAMSSFKLFPCSLPRLHKRSEFQRRDNCLFPIQRSAAAPPLILHPLLLEVLTGNCICLAHLPADWTNDYILLCRRN